MVVSGGIVHRSILSNLVYIDERAELDECIVMRGARIGKNCKLKRCIIDKWNEVPEGTVIGFDREQDEQRFTVSPTGIVVIGTNHQWE